jgi:3D (Asp-Asp-Asp) domain-containing protein
VLWYGPAPVDGRSLRLAPLAAAALAGLGAALVPAAGAEPAPTLRAQADALRSSARALDRAEHRALLELYAVESALARSREALARVRADAEGLAREQASLRRLAGVVQHSYERSRARVDTLLRELYLEGPEPDAIAVILGAVSLEDAAERVDGLRRAADRNQRLASRAVALGRTLERVRARLAERGRALARAQALAEAAARAWEQRLAARRAAVAGLRARRELTAGRIAALERQALAAQRRSAALAATVPPAPLGEPPPVALPAPAAPARPALRTLVVDALAYHLPGRTASGLPVGPGIVAVDPRVIPLGTRLWIPGYGPAVAADVGTAIRGNVIDLWMPSPVRALAWGRRTITITIGV